MSGNPESDKDVPKAVPLDLARSQISSVRTVEGKPPLAVTGGSLRNMRVLAQGVSNTNPTSIGASAIITTNLVPQAVLKPDSSRPQLASIITSTSSQTQVSGNLTRPTQITLSTTPLIAQHSTVGAYHVPRGPAVVANLAAPRSNVTTVRTPMVVAAQNQQHTFVRPPRTPSPAQGAAWLANSSNSSQIKGSPTILTSPVRSTTVTGKPQIIGKSQSQAVTTIRPGAILQNTISIGQPGQIQSFKQGTTGIQALTNVTIAHVIPCRSQPVVYSAGTTFTSARLTVANTSPSIRSTHSRSIGQVTTARLTVPVCVSQQARIIPPQSTVLPGTRIATIPSQSQPVLASSSRIVNTQPSVTINRLSVATTPAATNSNLLGQTRISTLNLHSLVAVANTTQARTLQAQGAKVITQPAQGTIHLTPLTNTIKTTTANIVTTAQRTINVPTAIISQQRQATVVPSQAISISKVFSQTDNQGTISSPANVFIHTQVPSTTRRTSPSPIPTTCIAASSTTVTTTSVPTYSLASAPYFYDNLASSYSVNRTFPQQSTAYSLAQSTQSSRPSLNTQMHSIVTNQQMRYNPVMVVDQSRGQQGSQQFSVASEQQEHQLQQTTQKVTSSPRPSILRKRDHEGSPLKAAKNLNPVLQCMPVATPQAPISPPLSRPDSRGNGHSSGGSTTISATSSPGIAEVNEDSNHAPMNHQKEEDEVKPPMEMSPRKKPRKQQLTGNDLDEPIDDMQFISESATIKKESNDADDSDANRSDEPKDGAPEAGQVTTMRKPASASLLNSYRQNWKATHNHYLRHSDVKPKDERRPTIMDLANQYRVQEKVNGWKIHHLSTQMEDLADQEQSVYNQLTELLKCTESEENARQFDKDINRINELIKGNLQRIKIINDGMLEAKSQIMKIFDHKVHVSDIINRCASKRNFKKREKS